MAQHVPTADVHPRPAHPGACAGTVQEVPFRSYVETVLRQEWPGFYGSEALKTCAIAVKQFGWYYTIVYRGGRSVTGDCYDVQDNTIDQHYTATLAVTLALPRSGGSDPSIRSGRMPGPATRPGTGVAVSALRAQPAGIVSMPLWMSAEELPLAFGSLKMAMADLTLDGRADVILLSDLGEGGTRLLTLRNRGDRLVPFRTLYDPALDWWSAAAL